MKRSKRKLADGQYNGFSVVSIFPPIGIQEEKLQIAILTQRQYYDRMRGRVLDSDDLLNDSLIRSFHHA